MSGTKETFRVDGRETTVEARPLTLFCHQGDVRIDPTGGRIVVGVEETTAHARALSEARLAVLKRFGFDDHFRTMFGHLEPPATADAIRKLGFGVVHAIGLISILMEAAARGLPIYLRYPEAGLHPAAQAGFGSVLVAVGFVTAPPDASAQETANARQARKNERRRLVETLDREDAEPRLACAWPRAA
jgi:hypothetical protein